MKLLYFLLFTLGIAQHQNHENCYKILDSWWKQRKSHPVLKNSPWDTTCLKFSNNRSSCINRKNRDWYFEQGIIDEYERDIVPCIIVGGGSKMCVSNPCNHYNTGKCTLQETGGLCNWYTKEEASKFNVPYGCHRNPCHIGGSGKTSNRDCKNRGIPGFIECTYCRKMNKIGCQRIDVETTAQCAPVNSGIPPEETIHSLRTNKNCQCTNLTSFCKLDTLKSPELFVAKPPR